MQSHGIGKGRKPGIRNKTKVERIIDAVVAAEGELQKILLLYLKSTIRLRCVEKDGDKILYAMSFCKATNCLMSTFKSLA